MIIGNAIAIGNQRRMPQSVWSIDNFSKVICRLSCKNANNLTLDIDKITQIDDLSGNGNHATQITSASQPSYISVHPTTGKPAMDWGDTLNNKHFNLPSMQIAEMYAVMQYKDGLDSGFDAYNTIISGSGGVLGDPRIHGNIGQSILSGSSAITNQVSVNGSAFSSNMLPLPFSLCHFKFNTPSTDVWSLFKNTAHASRGWQGFVSEVVILSSYATDDEAAQLTSFLINEWGI